MMPKEQAPLLEQRVLEYIRKHQLLAGQPQLLVAVSGGPDSVCLLHILLTLSGTLGVKLHVAHLNHQLRGAEADADARYVADLAQSWGLPATIERRDVRAYRARYRTSLEEAAREVRYNFLAEVARSIGTERVAVGHTVDDQVETILMNLIRGSGTRGLRGLQGESHWLLAEHRLTVIRPLLEVSRTETLAYCEQYQLAPRRDTSNLSLSPRRNQIRHRLIPLLQSYNPQVVPALWRTAAIAADELAFLDEEALRLWGQLAREENGVVILEKDKFRSLPLALQRHLLRLGMEKLLGNIKDIEAQHIEQVVAALGKAAGKKIGLPHGLYFTIEYDRYLLGSDPVALSPLPPLAGEYPLTVPGETTVPGWQVAATMVNRDQMKADHDEFCAYLDLAQTGDELVVRPRQRGDRWQPLGMKQAKKLSQFMVDEKIPLSWRDRVPLVCSPQQLLWVVGWRIDERVKVTDTTQRILQLQFSRR